MDPLLSTTELAGFGLSENGLFGGVYLHADTIGKCLKVQVEVVLNFTRANNSSIESHQVQGSILFSKQ